MDDNFNAVATQEGSPFLALLLLFTFFAWRFVRKVRAFQALNSKNLWAFALIDFVLFPVAAYALGQILGWVAITLGQAAWRETVREGTLLLINLAVASGTARFIEIWSLSKKPAGQKPHSSQLSRTLLYGACWLIGLVVFLLTNGYYSKELWVSTGAAAAIIAFAMQQTLGDLFSGIALSIERPFRIGDWLRFSDGTEGEVTDINWRATRLKGWDNSTFVVPNGQLSRESFTNLHGPEHRYSPWYYVHVSGDADPQRVKELLERAARRCDSILKEPPSVSRLVDGTTIPYTYMVWVHFPNYPSMFVGREDLYREINYALREDGLETAAEIREVRHRPIEPSSSLPFDRK